jgi:hypothetical protein
MRLLPVFRRPMRLRCGKDELESTAEKRNLQRIDGLGTLRIRDASTRSSTENLGPLRRSKLTDEQIQHRYQVLQDTLDRMIDKRSSTAKTSQCHTKKSAIIHS